MNRVRYPKSQERVSCTNSLDRPQISIPGWVCNRTEEGSTLNTFVAKESVVQAEGSANALIKTQHPRNLISSDPTTQRTMRGGNRGLRGRLFYVLYISSGSPPGVPAPYHGTLRFKNKSRYLFITADSSIQEERWYRFSAGFRDSAPGYQELLRVISSEEVNR